MVPWRFFDYVRGNGENPFETWYALQEPEVRAAFKFTVHRLRAMDDWLNPAQKSAEKLFKLFTGKQIGLAELRYGTKFGKHKRKFRAVGLYRPDERDFILFAGCQEMMRAYYYKPRNVMKIAMKDKRDFDGGAGGLVERIERMT